jgi:hypothetical protein
MRLKLVCLFLVVLMSASAWAQTKTTPRFELFGGYTYLRSNPGDGFNGANSSGWESSLNWNWNRWLGIKGDVSGHYCCDGQTEHNFLFGPQITLRHERANIFFHGLAGVSHGTDTGFSETSAAWALGGGLDWKFKRWPRIALRPIQADYLGTHYSDSSQHNFRYSAGFVFSFGGNK